MTSSEDRPGFFNGIQIACASDGSPMGPFDAAHTLPTKDTITIRVTPSQLDIVEEYTCGSIHAYGPAGTGEERPLILKTSATMHPWLAEYVAECVEDEIGEIKFRLSFDNADGRRAAQGRLRSLRALLKKLEAKLNSYQGETPTWKMKNAGRLEGDQ